MDKAALDALRIHRSDERQATPKALWIGVAAGVVVVIALVAWWTLRGDVVEVRVALVTEVAAETQAAVLNASGYVTARRQATVSSKVTGKVIEVLIEEGMQVREGQVLARIDASTSGAALRLAQAQVAAAASSLEEIRVRLEEARVELRRAENLVAQKVMSESEVDRARAQVNALAARLAAQREELAVAQRQVQLRQQDVDDAVIRAPFSGVVVSKNAQPGEMISPMSAGGGFTRTGICTIVDMNSLEIEVDVNEAYITRVRPAQPVLAVLDAYPDWRIPAHVIAVIPTADRQKATVKVRIGFDQRDPRILPDMGVKVSFIADEEQAGNRGGRMAVPKQAIRRDGEQDIVFVVKDGKLDRRAVSVAGAEGDRVIVQSGLNDGENVVIEGPANLTDGQRVKPSPRGEREGRKHE